jgi:hypothetical protein
LLYLRILIKGSIKLIKDLNQIFLEKDTGVVMRNSLYTVWLSYITSAIRDVDKKVLNVIKKKNDYSRVDVNNDVMLYIEEDNSKNVSQCSVRHLPPLSSDRKIM